MQVSKARQFVVLFTLCCTAVLFGFAGSRSANWLTVIDQRLVVIRAPSRDALDAPTASYRRHRPQEASSVPVRDPLVDLYGNEVTNAVAKYLLDASGTVYEEHSPQTEVPRLAAPKS